MTTNTSPCDWPFPAAGVCKTSKLDSLDPAQAEQLREMAVELLWAWTGRKYGLCEVTVRPCRAEAPHRAPTFWGQRGGSLPAGTGWLPILFGGAWLNIGCGVCGIDRCGCAPSALTALALPGPVDNIVEIWVDGAHLPPEAYELRDQVLYRIDGGTWPISNNQEGLPQDPGSGAWTISYMRGLTVPVGGRIAAATLAEELAKALCGDDTCQLPNRVQSVTRQGVSMEVVQTEFADMKEGSTGIWAIDSWVASTQAPIDTRPAILSPDIPRSSMTGTFAGLGRGRTW